MDTKVPNAVDPSLVCPGCKTRLSDDGDATLPPDCPVCGRRLRSSEDSTTAPGALTPPKRQQLPMPPGYEVLATLGQGGMGTVVKARRTDGGQLVALKYLNIAAADGPTRERFLREGRLSMELRHPNIVAGSRIEFAGEVPILVFEYIEAVDLKSLIQREGKLPAARAVTLMKQVLAALDHAHDSGVVHRDLKSANVLVTADDVAKLSDFGTAHLRDAADRLTRTGALIGTPRYMAPEQALGQPVTIQSDIYAAGVILFEMLSGQLPFQTGNTVELLTAIATQPAPNLQELAPDVSPRLGAAVARCLAKSPRDRFPSAEAMLRAIDPTAALAERAEATKPEDNESQPARPRRTTGRSRVLVVAQGPTATLDGAAVSSLGGADAGGASDSAAGLASSPGRPRPSTRPSRKIVAVAPPPPASSKVPWAVAGVLSVVALAALVFAWRQGRPRPVASPAVGTAVARSVAIVNEAEGQWVQSQEGRPVLALEVDPPQPLTATLVSPRGERELTRVETSRADHQVFEAPAELLIDPFDVRLAWKDGTPMAGGDLHHPGLASMVEGWRSRLKLDANGDVSGTKAPDRWAALLDALAAAVGQDDSAGTFARFAAKKGVMDALAAGTLARGIALRAKKPLAPLLAVAPVLLDLPAGALPLAKKRVLYDVLAPARVLDRLLACGGQGDLALGAEAALGRRFRAGPAQPVTQAKQRPDGLKKVGEGRPEKNLVSRGGMKGGADDFQMFSMAGGSNVMQKGVAESLALAVILAGAPGDPEAPARLDLECHKYIGAAAAVRPDDLLWVTLKDRGWRFLVHAGCLSEVGHANSNYTHELDRTLLDSTTRIQIVRDVLPSPGAKLDRRVDPLNVVSLTVWR